MLGKTALLVAAVLGVPAVTSCSTDSGTEGSGTEASNVRKVPSFNAVEASGQADAVVTVGHARKVTVRGEDNLLEHVETKVNGDELEISQDEDIDPKAGITVDIHTPALNTVTVSGVGRLTARGRQQRRRRSVSSRASADATKRPGGEFFLPGNFTGAALGPQAAGPSGKQYLSSSAPSANAVGAVDQQDIERVNRPVASDPVRAAAPETGDVLPSIPRGFEGVAAGAADEHVAHKPQLLDDVGPRAAVNPAGGEKFVASGSAPQHGAAFVGRGDAVYTRTPEDSVPL